MSEIFKIEKVISALPTQLTANTIYVVRVGTGYEMYVTDVTGAIAHKLNDEKITKLQNRKLNFKNILAMSPADLSSDFFSFSIQTIQETIKYEQNFPDYLGMSELGLFKDHTYKLTIHFTYSKGSTPGDKLQIYINEQDTGTLQQIEEIDLSTYESGDYTYEKEFTANADYQFLATDYIFESGSTSKIRLNSAGCYNKEDIKENDLFDDDLILPYNYLLTTVFSFANRINDIPQEVIRGNQAIRNQGVNLLHADYSNPQKELYDYSDYIFDAPYELIEGFDKSVKAWKFDIDNTTDTSKVIFNLNGYGDDVLTPALRLNRSKYIFSFYAKSLNANTHFIKFQLNSGVGVPYAVKEIEINAGFYQYVVLLDLPQLNYAIQFFVNSRGVDGASKSVIIERMMLEEISWQDFDVNDSTYVPQPSQYIEGIKNLPNVIDALAVEYRGRSAEIATTLTNLENKKLDKVDYVQHFKGVFTSYAALQEAIPVATDGDYAHIDSGQGFDRMGAIWDTSDQKWIVQSVNVGTNTDEVPEGSTNLYFKSQRVLDTILTGLDTSNGTGILPTDKALSAFGKLQGQIGSILSNFAVSVRSTTLSGLILSNASKITSSDTVISALGKIQAQLNGINAGPQVWVNATTLTSPTWHSSVDQAKSKIEFSVYNGMVYIKGFITITSALGSSGGIVLFSHKDTRFMTEILFHTGFSTFNVAQIVISSTVGTAAATVAIGQSTLDNSQGMTTIGAMGAALYGIRPICLGPVKP